MALAPRVEFADTLAAFPKLWRELGEWLEIFYIIILPYLEEICCCWKYVRQLTELLANKAIKINAAGLGKACLEIYICCQTTEAGAVYCYTPPKGAFSRFDGTSKRKMDRAQDKWLFSPCGGESTHSSSLCVCVLPLS